MPVITSSPFKIITTASGANFLSPPSMQSGIPATVFGAFTSPPTMQSGIVPTVFGGFDSPPGMQSGL